MVYQPNNISLPYMLHQIIPEHLMDCTPIPFNWLFCNFIPLFFKLGSYIRPTLTNPFQTKLSFDNHPSHDILPNIFKHGNSRLSLASSIAPLKVSLMLLSMTSHLTSHLTTSLKKAWHQPRKGHFSSSSSTTLTPPFKLLMKSNCFYISGWLVDLIVFQNWS